MADRDSPATKGDLLDLKAELTNEFKNSLGTGIQGLRDEFKDDLNNSIQGLRDELIEAIRDSQTEVLRAFYGFVQTVQDRFKEQDATEAMIKRRVNTLESRILEIEKRLNIPPTAA